MLLDDVQPPALAARSEGRFRAQLQRLSVNQTVFGIGVVRWGASA